MLFDMRPWGKVELRATLLVPGMDMSGVVEAIPVGLGRKKPMFAREKPRRNSFTKLLVNAYMGLKLMQNVLPAKGTSKLGLRPTTPPMLSLVLSYRKRNIMFCFCDAT